MEENMSQTIVTCPKCKTSYTSALIELTAKKETHAPAGLRVIWFDCANEINGEKCGEGLNAYRLNKEIIPRERGDAMMREYMASKHRSDASSHFRASSKIMTEAMSDPDLSKLVPPLGKSLARSDQDPRHETKKEPDLTAARAMRVSVVDDMSRLLKKGVGGPQLEAMRARLRETAQATGRSVSLDSEVDLVKEAMHQVADCLMEFSARETFDREDMYVMLSEVESVFTEVRTALPLYGNEDQMR
jgi:hypothetical protein